jgi:hypothetical protein
MKQFLAGAIALLLISSCNVVVKKTKEEAITHNDTVIAILNPYFDARDKFEDALADDESDLKAAYTEFKNSIDKIIRETEALPEFDKEDALKKASVEYMTAVKNTVNSDFGKLVEIRLDPDYTNYDSERNSSLLDQYNALYNKADSLITVAGENFDKKQDAFAAGYDFKIDRNY